MSSKFLRNLIFKFLCLNDFPKIFFWLFIIQVNLYQKFSFLNQLTHNMTRNCSLNPPKNTSSEHVVFKYCFECQNEKKQFLYTTCSELVLFGKFNKQSLVMLWVNWCNNGASDKDLPVWISIIKTMTILTSDRKVKMGNYLIMPLTLADDLFSNDTIQDCLYKLGMKTCVQI